MGSEHRLNAQATLLGCFHRWCRAGRDDRQTMTFGEAIVAGVEPIPEHEGEVELEQGQFSRKRVSPARANGTPMAGHALAHMTL